MCESCCAPKGMRIWATVMLAVSIAAFSIGVYLPSYINDVVNTGIDEFVTIDASAQASNNKYYRTWVNPDDPDSAPIYYSVYMWHLTNPAGVLAGQAPNMQEKGPYVYWKKTYKNAVNFTSNVYGQNVVTFRTQTQYVFQPSRSAGTEGDIITNINLVFQNLKTSSGLGTAYAPYAALGPLADGARFFQTQNVSAWLWGYPDPVVAKLYQNYYPYYPESIFPGLLGPNQNNDVVSQPVNQMFVGSKPDQSLIRQYLEYNGMQSLITESFVGPPTYYASAPTWGSGLANRVFGTDGTQFPRDLQDNAVINAYVSQLTRTITLANQNAQHITFKNIDLLHFTLPQIYLGNAATYPPNADFYMFGYYGMANLTATGTPDFYVSKPHFLDADPAILATLQGVSAGDPNLHDTYLNVEPMSGTTMQAAKRLQLSLRINPANVTFINPSNGNVTNQLWGPGIAQNGGKGQYVPLYWAEEYGEITDSSASSFTSGVYGGRKAAFALYIAGEVIGCSFVLGALIMFYVAAMKDQNANSGTKL